MNLSEFAVRHGFPQGKLYRLLRKFSEETIRSSEAGEGGTDEDGLIERDVVESGFRFAFDQERGRVTYEIYDAAKFKPLALRLTRYAVLSEEELERLLSVAQLCADAARVREHGGRRYGLYDHRHQEWYAPNAVYWDEVDRLLAKVH